MNGYPHALTVEAALEILDVLENAKEGLSLSEVACKLGMYKSRAHRLVRSLERKGFATRVGQNGKFFLGAKLIALGRAAHLQLNVLSYAQPVMERLAQETKATVVLRILDRDELLAICLVESPEVLKVSYPVGSRSPFYYGACGKLLSAYLSEGQFEDRLRRVRLRRIAPKTIIDPKEFRRHLQLIRRRGYAFSDEEGISGVRAVAAPVIDPQGQTIAALGVGLPKHQLPLGDVTKLVKQTKKAAEKISSALRNLRNESE